MKSFSSFKLVRIVDLERLEEEWEGQKRPGHEIVTDRCGPT